MTSRNTLEALGWCRFGFDPALKNWVSSVLGEAVEVSRDPIWKADWLRCGGTWFAGVNALANDAIGAVKGGPRLQGAAIDFAAEMYGHLPLDRAQVSVIYPTYPQPMAGESVPAFRFRRDRDAAHVDGVLPLGPARRRHLKEPHSYVLGLPLVETSVGASPMVIWEGSHLFMRAAFHDAFQSVAPESWLDVDVTEIYQTARRHCFEHCRRVSVHAQPGEAYLIHRLALHGVAPWERNATAPEEGRMIAYFRPELSDVAQWLA